MPHELGKYFATIIETDEGVTKGNVTDALYAIAGAIHHLAEVIHCKGEPEEDEPCVCPECREALKNRTQ